MKKQENKKFEFEKFEVAKLKNHKKIIGGTSIIIIDPGDFTTTYTIGRQSTDDCK